MSIVKNNDKYPHFMIKEIHEQTETIKEELAAYIKNETIDLSELGVDNLLQRIKKVYFVGCGTAYHAGLVGNNLIEKLVKIPAECDIASEFAYRDIPWGSDELLVVISQSGETTDTLVALREAKKQGIPVIAVTNVINSTMAQEADKVIYTKAGKEVSIASTKAYTSQLVIMYILALYIANLRGTIAPESQREIVQGLNNMDNYLASIFAQEKNIQEIAQRYYEMHSTFYLGRGIDSAVAKEGALKLKETSYIHAEAYPTGELKHGPIALVTKGLPIITVITQDRIWQKSMANIKEIKEHGGRIIAVCTESIAKDCWECDDIITIPNVNPIITPILSVVPLQMLAYYIATLRGNDVDTPRNLTKSVQIE